MPIRFLAFAAVFLTLPAAATGGHEEDNAPGKYRHAVYQVIRWNWQPMGAMVRGDQAFDASEFALRATRVSFLSHQLDEAYPPGSGGENTDALPAIWENRADFDAKLEAFQREAQLLRIAAKAGDKTAIGAQFIKTGATCKACHDHYRAD